MIQAPYVAVPYQFSRTLTPRQRLPLQFGFQAVRPPPPEVLTKLKVARAPRTRPARARPVVRIALERPARHSGARLGRCQIERAGVFIGYSVVVLRLGAVDRK